MKLYEVLTNTSIGVCSLLAGISLGGNGASLNAFSLAALISIPSVYGLHIVIDTRATNRINKAEKKASDSVAKLEKNQVLLSEIEQRNAKLNIELATVQQALKQTQDVLNQGDSERSKLLTMVASLTPAIAKLEAELLAAKGRMQQLEGEVSDWEENFHAAVDLEADKRFKEAKRQEIQRIFDEHDAITSEAMGLLERLQTWGHKVASSHEAKREMIKSLAHSYNLNIDSLSDSFDNERVAYLQQIEILREKVGQLQHELNGDLIEPQYGQFGYAIEGKIANDIARRVWEDLQIPLAVKGYQVKPDGSIDVGYGYSRSTPVEALVNDFNRHSGAIAKALGIHKISNVRKLEIADLLVLTFRREPMVKEDTVKLLAGTPEEFINYITSHPIRYRLIADPGEGKSPTAAVMVSEILKTGCKRGNVPKGSKVPYTLVTVSYPGVQSSLKDSNYPLDLFLEFGTETSAVKSFQVALEDWEYRRKNLAYAEKFFQLWVWDEFDNTVNSSSDPQTLADRLKLLLKQGGHNNIGWIVSGQSVMTKQIPGFTNDDRSLFIEIIIGIPKIRHYLNTYGKGKNSDSNLAKLSRNLEQVEEYIEHKNEMVTDDARLLRVALVVDSRSPKLYFLPNLDNVSFSTTTTEQTRKLARQFREGDAGMYISRLIPDDGSNPCIESTSYLPSQLEKSPIGGRESQPHCPECGSANVKPQSQNRYKCGDCGVRRVESKMVWK
jgi:ribosomal protein S27AE